MSTRHYYVDEFTDEIIPCAPTLEAWAKWLSQPDDDCPHDVPANGATLAVSTIDELATATARRENGAWTFDAPPPEGCDGFVARAGRTGWDAETWSETPLGYLEEIGDWYEDGAIEEIVCTKSGPNLRCRFDAAGPSLVVLGTVQ